MTIRAQTGLGGGEPEDGGRVGELAGPGGCGEPAGSRQGEAEEIKPLVFACRAAIAQAVVRVEPGGRWLVTLPADDWMRICVLAGALPDEPDDDRR